MEVPIQKANFFLLVCMIRSGLAANPLHIKTNSLVLPLDWQTLRNGLKMF
jgi:hypothetical protein